MQRTVVERATEADRSVSVLSVQLEKVPLCPKKEWVDEEKIIIENSLSLVFFTLQFSCAVNSAEI